MCESVLFGMPITMRPTACWRLDWEELENNQNHFSALCRMLQQKVHSAVLLRQHKRNSRSFITSVGSACPQCSSTHLHVVHVVTHLVHVVYSICSLCSSISLATSPHPTNCGNQYSSVWPTAILCQIFMYMVSMYCSELLLIIVKKNSDK